MKEMYEKQISAKRHDKAFCLHTQQWSDTFPIGKVLHLPDRTIELLLHFSLSELYAGKSIP